MANFRVSRITGFDASVSVPHETFLPRTGRTLQNYNSPVAQQVNGGGGNSQQSTAAKKSKVEFHEFWFQSGFYSLNTWVKQDKPGIMIPKDDETYLILNAPKSIRLISKNLQSAHMKAKGIVDPKKNGIKIRELNKGQVGKVIKKLAAYERQTDNLGQRDVKVIGLPPITEKKLEEVYIQYKIHENSTGSIGRVFSIKGKKNGHYILAAIDPKTKAALAELPAVVLKRKKVQVTFNFVSDRDANGIKRNKSTRTRTDVLNSIDNLNRIFTPQANIVISAKFATIDINRDIKTLIIRGNQGSFSSNMQYLIDRKAPGLNVFFAGTFWKSQHEKGTGGVALREDKSSTREGNWALVEDRRNSTEDFQRTIAHEIGHLLGAGHYAGGPGGRDPIGYLLGPHTNSGTELLTLQHARTMNQNAGPD